MTATKAYLTAWKTIYQSQRIWWLLYGITFAIALLSAIPLQGFMARTVGNSLALNKSLPGFDYTFLSDVLNEYGQSVDLILNQSLVLVFLFYLIAVFLMGGILAVFKQRPVTYDGSVFWSGCSFYFWRLLRLSIYFILMQAALLGIFTAFYFSINDYMNPFEADSEAGWIQSFRILAVIYLFLASFLFLVHDCVKWHVVHSGRFLLFKPFWEAFRLVFKHFRVFFSLYLLNIGTFLLIFGLYYFLKNTFVADTGWSIFLLFILTQLFVWMRAGLKLLNIAGVGLLYESNAIKTEALMAAED